MEKDGFLVNASMSALGLSHGVTTRKLGNMKDESKRRAATEALGLSGPVTLRQVHGTEIHQAVEATLGAEGDGLLGGGRPELGFGVYVADCVPLFVWVEDGSSAGVFHAGWRGTAAGMARDAVRAFQGTLARPEDLHAAIGPHIGSCCYKVGGEVAACFPPSAFARRGADMYLDLAAETRRQLLEAGLDSDRVLTEAPCTVCNPDLFYSFRRDKQDARMLALLSAGRRPA